MGARSGSRRQLRRINDLHPHTLSSASGSLRENRRHGGSTPRGSTERRDRPAPSYSRQGEERETRPSCLPNGKIKRNPSPQETQRFEASIRPRGALFRSYSLPKGSARPRGLSEGDRPVSFQTHRSRWRKKRSIVPRTLRSQWATRTRKWFTKSRGFPYRG